ncbi:transposable element Tcb1 transposase [Trichonephila clavipes]|nr:transposable element Tcb1 transposase [Trichonephila clavipes]
MRSARDQSLSLPIDVLGISLQRVPHVEAWRVGYHLSSPPRHSTGVPNDTVWRVSFSTGEERVSTCNSFEIEYTIFQQDNARPHMVRMSQDCLRIATILPLPASTPGLSPIEHIWDHLGRRVGYPTSLNELETRLQQIWNEMSPDTIQNLYTSMPDHIALCIRSRGVQ